MCFGMHMQAFIIYATSTVVVAFLRTAHGEHRNDKIRLGIRYHSLSTASLSLPLRTLLRVVPTCAFELLHPWINTQGRRC